MTRGSKSCGVIEKKSGEIRLIWPFVRWLVIFVPGEFPELFQGRKFSMPIRKYQIDRAWQLLPGRMLSGNRIRTRTMPGDGDPRQARAAGRIAGEKIAGGSVQGSGPSVGGDGVHKHWSARRAGNVGFQAKRIACLRIPVDAIGPIPGIHPAIERVTSRPFGLLRPRIDHVSPYPSAHGCSKFAIFLVVRRGWAQTDAVHLGVILAQRFQPERVLELVGDGLAVIICIHEVGEPELP